MKKLASLLTDLCRPMVYSMAIAFQATRDFIQMPRNRRLSLNLDQPLAVRKNECGCHHFFSQSAADPD